MYSFNNIEAWRYYEAVVNEKYELVSSNISEAKNVLREITTEKYNTFGLTPQQQSIAELRRDIQILEAEMALSKDYTYKVFIAENRRKLKDVEAKLSKSEFNYYKNCGEVSKRVKFLVESRKILLIDYLALLS